MATEGVQFAKMESSVGAGFKCFTSGFFASASQLIRSSISAWALLFVLLWQPLCGLLSRFFVRSMRLWRFRNPPAAASRIEKKESVDVLDRKGVKELSNIQSIREAFSEKHLRRLIEELENEENDCWEDIIDKKKQNVSYRAKRCDPKDNGPTKYLSTTVFENCDTDLLRDFYMDNEFRKEWDKTVVECEQLEIDTEYGIETGRLVKKFSFLKAREYILAWRLWEGKDKSYYCLTVDCRHPLAPETHKYVRVNSYYSGWRIQKVNGRYASEVKIVHQEDAGLPREMTKLAFSKRIWSYVLTMDANLRKYTHRSRMNISQNPNAVSLMQKVPFEVDGVVDVEEVKATLQNSKMVEARTLANSTKAKKILRIKEVFSVHSKKELFAKGLLVVGGAVCVTRGSSVVAKLAVACLVNKMAKKRQNGRNFGH